MAKIQARERARNAVYREAQAAAGIHRNRVSAFVGDRATGETVVRALQLENQTKTYSNDRVAGSPTWGYLEPIQGIDY